MQCSNPLVQNKTPDNYQKTLKHNKKKIQLTFSCILIGRSLKVTPLQKLSTLLAIEPFPDILILSPWTWWKRIGGRLLVNLSPPDLGAETKKKKIFRNLSHFGGAWGRVEQSIWKKRIGFNKLCRRAGKAFSAWQQLSHFSLSYSFPPPLRLSSHPNPPPN